MTYLQNELIYYIVIMYFLAGFVLFIFILARNSMKKQINYIILKKILIKIYILIIVFCVSLGTIMTIVLILLII